MLHESDTDNSGTIDEKELYFKITGLKEFDFESTIEIIKENIVKRRVYLFESFQEKDPKARLVLGKPSDLQDILSSIKIELSEDHLSQLYLKYCRSGKF